MRRLKEFYNKNVRIKATNGRQFEGMIDEYVYSDDNENGKESIVMNDLISGNWIEFYDEDIKAIEIL